MRKLTNYIAITVILSSCSNPNKNMVLLTSGDSKDWDLLQENSVSFYVPGNGMSFNIDGKYSEYCCDEKLNKKSCNLYDQVFTYDWELKSDSIIVLSEVEVKILRLTEDTLILQYPNDKKLTLAKSKFNDERN